MVFKSDSQLEKFLLQKCRAAVSGVEQKVFNVIDKCLKQYYAQFEPEYYKRTEQLLRSLVRTRVEPDGKNGYKAEVYFDASMLNYETGWVELKKPLYFDEPYGYATWSGDTVLDVAMTGSYGGLPHGGYAGGTAIWTKSEAMIATMGGVWKMLEQELKILGVPIVK